MLEEQKSGEKLLERVDKYLRLPGSESRSVGMVVCGGLRKKRCMIRVRALDSLFPAITLLIPHLLLYTLFVRYFLQNKYLEVPCLHRNQYLLSRQYMILNLIAHG